MPAIGGLLLGIALLVGELAVEGVCSGMFLTRTFTVLLPFKPLLSVTINWNFSVVSADTVGAVKDQIGVLAPLMVIKLLVGICFHE